RAPGAPRHRAGGARHRGSRGRPGGGLPPADRRRGDPPTGGGGMNALVYTRYELTRTFRNRRLLFFSLGFPLVLFFLIASPNRHEQSLGGSGISAPLYLMVGLAAFGTMNTVITTGARIALERTLGWTRQLRLTPLSPRVYFGTKLLTA